MQLPAELIDSKKGIMSFSSVSCGSSNQEVTGTYIQNEWYHYTTV